MILATFAIYHQPLLHLGNPKSHVNEDERDGRTGKNLSCSLYSSTWASVKFRDTSGAS